MPTLSFLDFQYNLSKRKFLRKPTRLFSRQESDLLPVYQLDDDEMKRVFDKFDSNKDGKISKEEYKVILKALGKESTTREVVKILEVADLDREVVKIFEVADLDRDGFIDFKEFMAVQNKGGGVKKMDVQSAFRTFDSDGDGKISAEEVHELLRRLGEKCTLSDCRKMVSAVDANGDGVIDMDEFMTMMTRDMKLC